MRAKSKILLFVTVILLSMVHVGMPKQTLTRQIAAIKHLTLQSDFDLTHDYSFSDSERVKGGDVYGGISSDGYVLSHKTANAYSYNRDQATRRMWHITHRRQLVKAYITSFSLMKDGKILNSKIAGGYTLCLSYETSGTIASVNRLFALGSVRC